MAALDPNAYWVSRQWRRHFAEVIASRGGGISIANEIHEAGAASRTGILWWKQTWSLGEEALVWVGAPTETWNSVGALETYLNTLSQSLAALAEDLSARLHREVRCLEGCEVIEAPPPQLQLSLLTTDGAARPLYLAFSGAFTQALPPPLAGNSNLGLLMDVELPVTICFGRAQVRIRDVLKFTAGSIVELDRLADDPVEIVVNNRVIARGEVVVIDGNYGVRIQEISSARERLDTTREATA